MAANAATSRRAGVTEMVMTHGEQQNRAELNHELGSIQ